MYQNLKFESFQLTVKVFTLDKLFTWFIKCQPNELDSKVKIKCKKFKIWTVEEKRWVLKKIVNIQNSLVSLLCTLIVQQ